MNSKGEPCRVHHSALLQNLGPGSLAALTGGSSFLRHKASGFHIVFLCHKWLEYADICWNMLEYVVICWKVEVLGYKPRNIMGYRIKNLMNVCQWGKMHRHYHIWKIMINH